MHFAIDSRRPSRRDFLVGAGATALAAGRAPYGWSQQPRAAGSALEELVQFVSKGTSAEVFDGLPERMRRGLTPGDLLAATCVAGSRHVRPRPHGILHCVMMVESSYQLAGGASPREAWLAALWNLDDYKRAEASNDREWDGWRMQPLALPKRSPGPAAARAEFVAALDAWDAERADRALVQLLPQIERAELFELLWPFAGRCYAFIGHKAIYAAQLERTLGRMDWQHAQSPLRSLVASLLVDRNTAAFEHSRELAAALPADWSAGRESNADTTRALWHGLRSASAAESAGTVSRALREGCAPSAIWDALRLGAAEIFRHRPGRRSNSGRLALLPVHAVTVTEAWGHVFRTSNDDATRRLALLQAASWLAQLRIDLGNMVELTLDDESPDLGAAAEAPENLTATLGKGSPAAATAFFAHAPESHASAVDALRSALLRSGREHHQHKYAAATFEEARRAAPELRPFLLAGAVDYLAHPNDTESELHRRSLRVLEAARD